MRIRAKIEFEFDISEAFDEAKELGLAACRKSLRVKIETHFWNGILISSEVREAPEPQKPEIEG